MTQTLHNCDKMASPRGVVGNVGVVLLWIFSLWNLPLRVNAAASEPLLNSQYIPKSDIDFVVDLTEILEGIQIEQEQSKGLTFYNQSIDGEISLRSLSVASAESYALWRKHNPLYSVYLYGLWRSSNGNGHTSDESFGNKLFDRSPIDEYGDTIIMDEFSKPSGYDPQLTSETILVTNMWMAVVHSLYEGVALCSNGMPDDDDDPNFVNPIDKAAALWIGTHDDPTSIEGGSLYAWSNRIRLKFSSDFNANGKIVQWMDMLQSRLDTCLGSATTPSQRQEHVSAMRLMADDITRFMTVPLVQSLVYQLALMSGQTDQTEPDAINYLVLYALVTLPPVIVCDREAFDEMYKQMVTSKDDFDPDNFSQTLDLLQSRYVCLGITCSQVGDSLFMDGDWPVCEDPTADTPIAGYMGTSDDIMEVAKSDLDVRTIGTLVEMESNFAAFDVYSYGRFSRDTQEDVYYSLQQAALQDSHPQNTVASSYINTLTSDTLGNKVVYEAITDATLFTDASSLQRRIVTEATLVTIVLHVYAMNAMYSAIDTCQNGQKGGKWDEGVAALIGWAEGSGDGGSKSNGYLFYEVAQFLCTSTGTCNIGNDSEINRLLMKEFRDGKQHLEGLKCDMAEESLKKVEVYLLTVLVDVVAYFAYQIDDNPTNPDNLAESYALATALHPLMRKVDEDAANVIQTNMAVFSGKYLVDGTQAVYAALKDFIDATGIDCSLLTQNICGDSGGSAATGSGATKTPTTVDGMTTTIATTVVTKTPIVDPGPPTTGATKAVTTGATKTPGTGGPSDSFLADSYNPTSDVDHIIALTATMEAISTSDDYQEAFDLYNGGSQTADSSLASLSKYSVAFPLYRSYNPLYSIFMYAFWKSNDGSGLSDDKQFDNSPIDMYGNTIIMDEFNKKSGFNAKLTAETISVTNMWMSTAHSLYEGVNLCSEGNNHGGQDYFDPIDKAAAFWIGNHEGAGQATGSSLYALTNRIQSFFTSSDTTATHNKKIVEKMKNLKERLTSCMVPELTDEQRDSKASLMRVIADDITRHMTIPLVQNLIYYMAVMAGKIQSENSDIVDYMILYALVTLPPIIVCNKSAFDSLYEILITKFDSFDSDSFVDALDLLQSHYICLGITCEQVGDANFMDQDWPICNDPPMNARIAGYVSSSDEALDTLKTDLDVRTVGTLVEMEADDAALDVYRWGRFSLATLGEEKDYFSLEDDAVQENHYNNIVATAFQDEYETDYPADEMTKAAISKSSMFSKASPIQRRIVAEATIVTSALHIYAMDSFYTGLELCSNQQIDDFWWDDGVAALVGWAEGEEDGGSTTNGFLFYEISQYLCKVKGKCNISGDSNVNRLLMAELKSGKESLKLKDCDVAEESLNKVENYLQTILVDIVAYFAERIDEDPTDASSLAEGYAVATALIPLMRDVDHNAADIIQTNLGSFPNEDVLQDGKAVVFDALKDFVDAKGIDCDLLTNDICDEGPPKDGGVTPTPFPDDGDSGDTDMPGDGDNGDIGTPNDDGDTNTDTPDEDTNVPDDEAPGGANNVVGVPPSDNNSISSPLLSGAYTPKSHVEHILRLTDLIGEIEKSTSFSDGLSHYTQTDSGVSLQSLSTDIDLKFVTKTNPLFTEYSYGLWISNDGENDKNGYSNKKFDNADLASFGNTIIMDEFDKGSGYNPTLTAETIRVTNVWMAFVTELYRAVESCRDDSIDSSPASFNPIDFAAAFWFGNHQDKTSVDGSSLFAWSKRAEDDFVEATVGVNDKITQLLNKMQSDYEECKGISDRESFATNMRYDADQITRSMTIPLVRNFITHLAKLSGLSNSVSHDEANYVVLYSLAVLPLISICDEDTFYDLYDDLITRAYPYDSSKFEQNLKQVQDRFECLGITCSEVGKSELSTNSWPSCEDSPMNRAIAGYIPTSGESLQVSKVDMDISSILTFVLMEANDAAMDIYDYGRNMGSSTSPYLSVKQLFESVTGGTQIYDSFVSEYGDDYTGVTKSAILGINEFELTSPLKNSAAASTALVAIDSHLLIAEYMDEAISRCNDGGDGRNYWDRAVALTVGWTEGSQDGGSDFNGYLFYDLAQDVCVHLDSCDENGDSEIDQKIIDEFKNGQQSLKDSQCPDAIDSANKIEIYLQVILLNNLVYRTKEARVRGDGSFYTQTYVTAKALIPLIREVSESSADTIDFNLGEYPLDDISDDDIEAVLAALKSYATAKNIDCSLLDDAICDGSIIDDNPEDDNDGTTNDTGHSLADGEYTPFADVENLSSISSIVNLICTSKDVGAAKNIYSTDRTAGLTIQSMSLDAGHIMSDELLFNQYVNAIHDRVDKKDGTLIFDDFPAEDYANTITIDALDTSTELGCESLKVLNLWMYVVHKLNEAVEECKSGDPKLYSAIDEAAALWIGNPIEGTSKGALLFELAEELGGKFGSTQGDTKMSYLNSEIITRLIKAQQYFAGVNRCKVDDESFNDVRIIVKETTSLMTAVLVQGLIHSMLGETHGTTKKESVELFAFAFLPRVESCGHETDYKNLYSSLVDKGFEESMTYDILSSVQRYYNCLGLSCSDIGTHLLATDNTLPECLDNLEIAGYAPANQTKTNRAARLDLDAVAIHQLMSMEKYDVAKSIYLEGHNFYDYDDETLGFVSLRKLAKSETIGFTGFKTFSMYQTYFEQEPGDFAHDLILEAFEQTGRFKAATGDQRKLSVQNIIKSSISYFSSLEALHFAVSVCNTDTTKAMTGWDGGVALLIGSVEGTEHGGSDEGYFFYSLAKDVCETFQTCAPGGDALVNEELYKALIRGQGFITDSSCDEAEEELESIELLLTVPLIQSVLRFSEESPESDSSAAGYVASVAVLPIVHNADPEAATNVKKAMAFPPNLADTSSSRSETVYDAFRTVLSHPKFDNLDCDLVSTTNRKNICDPIDAGTTGPTISIKPEEPTPISNGLYIASNYVSDRSAIAQDVEEIETALKSNDPKKIERVDFIYRDGLNSKIYNRNGIPTGETRSISSFSLDSKEHMRYDPTYNLFIYGLADENQEFLSKPVVNYADTFVTSLLKSKKESSTSGASEAMVALNVWMQVVNKLHSAHRACESSFHTDGTSTEGRSMMQTIDASLFIDEAAAYWIGDNQSTGSSNNGHLLYALTEFIDEKFGGTKSNQESPINARIIDLFNQAKNHIAISKSCSTSKDSHLKLKNIVDQLIPLMAAPLLRCLFYYLNEGDAVRTRLYALSVLPLFSGCSLSTFLELKSDLIDGDVNQVQKEYIFSRIHSMYECLELTCEMVGFMPDSDFTRCEEPSRKVLAGYSSTAERSVVTQHSQIDLDINHIDIFIDNGLNVFKDGEDVLFKNSFQLYNHGRGINIVGSGYFSLSDMATSAKRDIVPVYKVFRRYFKDEDDYADSIIVDAFQNNGVFEQASIDQRKRVILFALRYMVTYMSILENLYSALQFCKEDNQADASSAMDTAAAYIIGSLEGEDDGGTFDGMLLFMLAKRMCIHFGTCSASGNAISNEQIISHIYAGQGEIETMACDSLEKTNKEIEKALLVPIIQGVLYASFVNEFSFNDGDSESTSDDLFPEGYILSLSVLPIIDAANEKSSKAIKKVMVDGFPSQDPTISADHKSVFDAVKNALPNLEGVDCVQLGSYAGASFCPGDDDDENSTFAFIPTVISSLVTAVVLSLFFLCQ